jgi:uncharacterized DUF497 family protein
MIEYGCEALPEQNRSPNTLSRLVAATSSLWSDPDLLQVKVKTSDFPRYLAIGQVDGHHWSAAITYQDDRIKILSVRPSREEEVQLYESGRVRPGF